MIYITGDTHGELKQFDSPQMRRLKKEDTLIVCGDFGFLWNESREEQKALAKLSKKKYRILFVDGTHENYDLLNAQPEEEWNGGKVHKISENIYHLMRGQIFEIEGKHIFTFGGGESEDKAIRVAAQTWWAQEMPTFEEMQEGVRNLKHHDCSVDYIITHSPSPRMQMVSNNHTENKNQLEAYFNEIVKEVKFRRWFFGSMHIDRKITASNYAVFQEVLSAEDPDAGMQRRRRR